MIEYEINKPGLLQNIGRAITALTHVPQQQQRSPTTTQARTWGKFPYTVWIEIQKLEWAVGDYVCPIGVPVNKTGAPFYYGIIEGVNELHYLAEVDVLLNEPRAIVVRLKTGEIVNYAPRALRHFTEEERNHAILRDKPVISNSATH